ncbi:hypothetical protein HDA32_000331 [Spinactinospora alkalitolerans]|uniref:Uncharacterized protein n=1 Tax=Spinactinospora alkalitolerans TaxID=687207 RepID=A0A852TP51_9ACTN|nr:hypothetical protein [Spinactinospora alkalitolerans]
MRSGWGSPLIGSLTSSWDWTPGPADRGRKRPRTVMADTGQAVVPHSTVDNRFITDCRDRTPIGRDSRNERLLPCAM